MNKKVAFVVKIFRDEPHITRCIDSVLKQTYRNLSFYIIHGEKTQKKIMFHAKRDERIIPCYYEKDTVMGNFEVLEKVKESGADYYTWIDGDDWYEVDFLEKTLEFAQNNHLDIVAGGYREIGLMGECLRENQIQTAMIAEVSDTKKWFIEGWSLFTSTWGILFNIDVLKKVNIYSRPDVKEHGNRGADTMFNYAVLPYAQRLGFIPDCIYNYQMTENSHSLMIEEGRLKSSATILKYIKNFLQIIGDKNYIHIYFLYTQYACNVLECINLVLLSRMTTDEKFNSLVFLLSQQENQELFDMTIRTRGDQFQNMYLDGMLKQKEIFTNEQLWKLINIIYPQISYFMEEGKVSYENEKYILECKNRLVNAMTSQLNAGRQKFCIEEQQKEEEERKRDMESGKKVLLHLVNEGKWEEANNEVNNYLKENPFDAEIAIFKASIQSEQGEAEEAINTIQMGLKSQTDNYELYFMLGNLYSQMEKYVVAGDCYEQAVSYCTVSDDREMIKDYLETARKNQLNKTQKEIEILKNQNLTLETELKKVIAAQEKSKWEYMELFRQLLVLSSNLKYEILDKNSKWTPFFPKIVSREETVEKIIRERKSIARFGDGEFSIISNIPRPKFQKVDEKLGARIAEILQTDDPKLLLGIAKNYGNLEEFAEDAADGIRAYMIDSVREEHRKWIDEDKIYYDAYITRPYVMYKDKFTQAPRKRFDSLKKIWENRNVIVVEGAESRIGVGNDLLKNVNSVRRILAPAIDSFNRYDDILNRAFKEGEIDILFLVAMGPSAGVLVYDLTKSGYQAIDIGHLDLEYEWFLAGKGKRVPISGKYNNEVPGGDIVNPINDSVYESQIIARFE